MKVREPGGARGGGGPAGERTPSDSWPALHGRPVLRRSIAVGLVLCVAFMGVLLVRGVNALTVGRAVPETDRDRAELLAGLHPSQHPGAGRYYVPVGAVYTRTPEGVPVAYLHYRLGGGRPVDVADFLRTYDLPAPGPRAPLPPDLTAALGGDEPSEAPELPEVGAAAGLGESPWASPSPALPEPPGPTASPSPTANPNPNPNPNPSPSPSPTPTAQADRQPSPEVSPSSAPCTRSAKPAPDSPDSAEGDEEEDEEGDDEETRTPTAEPQADGTPTPTATPTGPPSPSVTPSPVFVPAAAVAEPEPVPTAAPSPSPTATRTATAGRRIYVSTTSGGLTGATDIYVRASG
ncbi:hypothetical protein ACFVVX_04965 [Kitasatospora sp. NPDC058170]|uniref:hypothetical protein n=1 Tax=Kitasatospora sp. NPDC058170 TaxID=3346364 RepID=UPI0036D9AD54